MEEGGVAGKENEETRGIVLRGMQIQWKGWISITLQRYDLGASWKLESRTYLPLICYVKRKSSIQIQIIIKEYRIHFIKKEYEIQFWRLLRISDFFLKSQEYRRPCGVWSVLKDTTQWQIYGIQ